MADDKGILTREQENFLAQVLDEKIKFGNKILEAIDRTVFKSIITLVDDYGIDKINEQYKKQGEALAIALIEKNYEDAVIIVWELASLIIKELVKK